MTIPLPTSLKRPSVQRGDELARAPAQTPHALRMSGISKQNSLVQDLWFGKVVTGPGKASDPHHHGRAETACYVLQGHGYLRYGARYEEIIYLDEGDFVYVPAFVPHIEGNLSHTRDVVWMASHNPDNIAVNLTDQDIADIDIWYAD